MFKRLLAAACFAVMLVPGLAYAQAFTFNFQGNSVGNPLGIGNFTFTGGGNGTTTGASDPVLVTSLFGTLGVDGGQQAIVTGPNGTLGADNMISFLSPQVVSMAGVGFSTSAFGNLNIRFSGSTVDILNEAGTIVGNVTSGGVMRVAAVPGPVAGAGLIPLFGLAGAWYARRRKQLAA